jgi:transposase-like protein
MADVIYLLSNNSNDGLTVDKIRQLIGVEARDTAASAIIQPELPAFKPHRLEARLGPVVVAKVVRRYESGESATAIAKEVGVAPSALLRLLREQNVVVRKQGLTLERAAALAHEYKAGATMAELEKKYGLSHSTVFRALHRAGAEMRESAPRRRR